MKRILIAKSVSETTGIPVRDVERVIVETHKAIVNSVAGGENVFFRGFGTYGTKNIKAKMARNFASGTPMQVPAQIKIFFKPSPVFNEAVVDEPVTIEDIKKLFGSSDKAA